MDPSLMHISIRKIIEGPIAARYAALVGSTANMYVHFVFGQVVGPTKFLATFFATVFFLFRGHVTNHVIL